MGYLTKINRKDLHRDVILGVIAAISMSLVLAVFLLFIFQESIELGYQELVEGLVMFIASAILSFMVIWMWKRSRGIKGDMEERIDHTISDGTRWGIISLVFFSVFREGAELIIFLYASFTGTATDTDILTAFAGIGIGFGAGLVVALIISYTLFISTIRLNLKNFFNITSVILIIFAAGLLAHGIHEIFEFFENSATDLAELAIFNEAWNINNSPIGNGLELLFGWMYDPIFPGRFEKSTLGLVLTGLLGWNDNPAIVEVVAYILYYIIIGFAYFYIKNKPVQNSNKNNVII